MILKNIFFSLSVFLFSITLYAQDPLDPGWLWSERGGSSAALNGLTRWDWGMERILDIAVDGDNNYYYLAELGGYTFTLGDMEFDTYNSYSSMKDIFVFSTDSEGTYRWSKEIGGGAGDHAASIGLDETGNVYISGNVFNTSTTQIPIHFDTDTIRDAGTIATPSPKNKSAFLIKYNSNGDFQWLRMPEGDDAAFGRSGAFVKTVVDSNGQTHSLVWLGKGSYFNDALVVDEGKVKYVILNYNSNGNLEGFILLNMKPDSQFSSGYYKYQLAYDPNLDRYYIADNYRDYPDPDNPLSINGYGLETENKGFYLAAVNNQGEVIWYHENHKLSSWALGDVKLDDLGSVYLTGWTGADGGADSLAGYVFNPDGTGSGKQDPFLVKLDPDGNLLWGTNPDLHSPFPGQSIVVDGNNVYLGLGMVDNIWGGLDVPGPVLQGLVPDIQIIRFDAETGEAQEVIQNNHITFTQDAIMAMALDNNGDLVVGGYFGSDLFNGTDLHLHNNGQDSDFFIAKYHPDTGVGGLADLNLEKVKIYPNPTTGILNLQSEVGLVSYSLYDLQGRRIKQGNVETNQINLSGMESGVYVLRVLDRNGGVGNIRVVVSCKP